MHLGSLLFSGKLFDEEFNSLGPVSDLNPKSQVLTIESVELKLGPKQARPASIFSYSNVHFNF